MAQKQLKKYTHVKMNQQQETSCFWLKTWTHKHKQIAKQIHCCPEVYTELACVKKINENFYNY